MDVQFALVNTNDALIRAKAGHVDRKKRQHGRLSSVSKVQTMREWMVQTVAQHDTVDISQRLIFTLLLLLLLRAPLCLHLGQPRHFFLFDLVLSTDCHDFSFAAIGARLSMFTLDFLGRVLVLGVVSLVTWQEVLCIPSVIHHASLCTNRRTNAHCADGHLSE